MSAPFTENYNLDTDTLLGGQNSSDNIVSSQKAIKTYIDNQEVSSSIYIATYGTTSYADVLTAYNANKLVYAIDGNGNQYQLILYDNNANAFIFSKIDYDNNTQNNIVTYLIVRSAGWSTLSVTLADATDLNTKVNKAGDTMTGGLIIQRDDNSLFLRCQRTDAIKGTTPSSSKYWGLHFIDGQGSDVANRMGSVEARYTNTGYTRTDLTCYEPTNGSTTVERISIGCTADGDFYTYAPKPIASSDTNNIATTDWVNDGLYYRAGDTVTSLSDYIVAGYLTSSKTRLRFSIPLPKRMNKINTVTINTLVINARQGQAGYLPSATWNAKTGSTVSASFTNNMLHIECYSTTAFTSFTNNAIVNVAFDSFKCTFS